MDLPGEHKLKVDGSVMGKGHKARSSAGHSSVLAASSFSRV
jgi:hypothetical protein